MNEKFYKTFESSAHQIKRWANNSPIFYIPNIGNWGDGIIRYGSHLFLDHFEISYIEINELEQIFLEKELYDNAILLYQGSGAFCRLWDHSYIIKELSVIFKTIVILPSTYEFSIDIPNVQFFCRDLFESKMNIPKALFCHDFAFFISFNNINEGEGVGYFFRTDIESKNKINIPINNIDISLKGNHISSPTGFIAEIDKYKIVFTDRLHVAIVASLLNKIVHFYPGSYFKNRAVYLSSLKTNYPKTFFHSEEYVQKNYSLE